MCSSDLWHSHTGGQLLVAVSGRYIIGRMGLPYRQKNINIICVAVDAPQDVISAMAGKLGRVRGANIKTAYSNFTSTEPEIKTE